MAGVSHVRAILYQDHSLATFGAEYLRNGGNASKALETLHPDPTRSKQRTYAVAQRMKASELVQRMISEAASRAIKSAERAVERYGLSADIAAEELARAAYTEMRQVCDVLTIKDPDTGEMRQVVKYKDFNDIDSDAHKAISEVIQNPDGSVRYKLVDKLAAQMHLARLRGWVQDKPEQPIAAVQLIIQR